MSTKISDDFLERQMLHPPSEMSYGASGFCDYGTILFPLWKYVLMTLRHIMQSPVTHTWRAEMMLHREDLLHDHLI
jgi:hypothetical protein